MSEKYIDVGSAQKKTLQDFDLYDDFELNEIEDEEEITIYDIDNILGFTVDILKVSFPFLFLIALFVGMIFVVGIYL